MKLDTQAIWIDLNEELYKFVLGKVKDEQTAKDIHQEVFLKIETKIYQLKHSSKITSWVYTITRNTITDYFRKAKNQNIAIRDLDIPETAPDNFEYANLSNCINSKIDSLSAEHKEAIVLTSFKNYSQKELAQHLKNLLFRNKIKSSKSQGNS